MGEEVLDLTIDEDDYDETDSDSSDAPTVVASDTVIHQTGVVGFGSPWSVEYYDDED
jgi:hypothetical protein